MALKKPKTDEVVETKEEVNVDNSVETVDNPEDANGMNEEEKEVISNGAEDVTVANSEKINRVMQLLAHQFNIDDTFYLTKVDDKGNNITLGFANMDYVVSIKIKDLTEMGVLD